MANVAPKARKHLSADALFRLVHTGFDHIPDYRPADVDIALPDVLIALLTASEEMDIRSVPTKNRLKAACL